MRKVLLCVAGIILLTSCSSVFFYPTKDRVTDPGAMGLVFEERILDDGYGPRLILWDLRAQAQPQRGTVVYLHGNAENISTHLPNVAWLPQFGYRVILPDYRGYGGSEGTAEISGVHADVARVFRWLADQETDLSPPLILYGQSLGGSLALTVAAEPEFRSLFDLVIAESPFASYRTIAREKLATTWLTYPLQWPLGFLVPDHFSPILHIECIESPVLLLHGEKDGTVPFSHSEALCTKISGRCQLWRFPGAAHLGILGSVATRERLINALPREKTDREPLPESVRERCAAPE